MKSPRNDNPPAPFYFVGSYKRELRAPGRKADETGPETEWSEHYGRTEYWYCDLCGEMGEDPVWIGKKCVCYTCAEIADNVINLRHGGEYSTWTNPKPEKPPRKSISTTQRRRIHERDAYRCRYCGGYKNLAIDHMVPVCSSGSNEDENLVTACKQCNSTKGGNTPEKAGMILNGISQ